MDQNLKRKVRPSDNLDGSSLPSQARYVRPRLSDFACAPRQVQLTLQFLHDNGISLSSFLASLLSFDLATVPLQAAAVQDVRSNLDLVLQSFLANAKFEADTISWAHRAVGAVYKTEIQALTKKETGWHFVAHRARAAKFADFDMESTIQTSATRAPLLWDLFEGLFCAEGVVESEKWTVEELQFKRNVKKFACIAAIAHANNQQCNMLQVINGIFLHTCNAPERVIDLFFNLGQSCSQHTILAALESLSIETTEHIRNLGQTLLVSYAYDNFDMLQKSKTPTVEDTIDNLRHLTSGTLIPLSSTSLPDLKFAFRNWEFSRFNDMKKESPPRRTIFNLFELQKEAERSHGQSSHREFNSWQFLTDLCTYGPPYFRKFLSKIELPKFLEKVPVVKTKQVPARAMDLSNSKVDGNIATIESLLRQGGVQDTEKFAEKHPEIADPEDYVILFHGDLGSGERIQTGQLRRSLESTPRLRLQNVIFVPGLFHIKMACADALWRIFLEPADARSDETSFFASLASLRPSETTKIASGTAGYQILNECITHVGRVERLGWWTKVVQTEYSTCKTLDEFSKCEPTFEVLCELAKKLYEKYVSESYLRGEKEKKKAKRDIQYENTVLRAQHFLLYEETAHAIRSGDVGRVESCLYEWIPIFKGVGKHKYATMLLQFLTDVHFTYPPALRKTIRLNWFCNSSLLGKEMKFRGIDWLVELNNLLTKTIYGGHGSNNTAERVLKESVLIQLFRDIIHIVECEFKTGAKTSRHGDADMTATYTEMFRRMVESNTFVSIEGRKSAHEIHDAFDLGIYKFMTESAAQLTEILTNSKEAEQMITGEDIESEIM